MTTKQTSQPPGRNTPPNLWQQAWVILDDDVKDGINLRANSRRVVDSVLHTAKEKQQLCLRKRWKFRKSNGEEIIVRDVLDKIVSWLDKFKTIVDVATQYDPVHTSLLWAGVRFVLQMVVSDQHVFGATVEGIETISQLITRYTIFETLYLDCNSPIRAELESALVRLYKEVLAYLVKAKRYFQTSTTKRVLKSAFYTAEDSQMKAIEAEEKRVAALTTLADMEELKHTGENVAATQSLVKSLEQPILRMADETTTAMRRLEINKQSALLLWLSSVPFIQHHKDHIRKNIPGCGHWFLNHPEYHNWKSSSFSSILLLHGIPGSGKTSLVANVVDSFLQNRSGPNGSVAAPVAYSYCARNSFESQRSDPEEIMRSILRQLAFSQNNQKDIHEAVLNDYQRREDEAKLNGWDIPKLCISECVRLILDITLSYSVTIIIDAMDEVQDTRWHELTTALDTMVKESTNVVKILITSRDHFVKHIQSGHRVQIKSSNCRHDMAIFVRHHVTQAIHNRRLLGGNVSDDLREDLIQTLLTGAREMFLWVVLQINSLCQMKLEADVRTAMAKLPSDTLELLYTDTFTKICSGAQAARDSAMHAFSLLLCLQEPLSPTAFLMALSMADPDNSNIELSLVDVLDTCFNLIAVDSELDVLRFAHVSVQEFLESKPEFAPVHNHKIAATGCLNVCSDYISTDIGATLDTQKLFYHYGVLYWAEHVRLAEGTNNDLLRRAKEFVFCGDETSLTFLGWVEGVKELSRSIPREHRLAISMNAVPSPNYSPLFISCMFGISTLIQELANIPGTDWNQKNDIGHTGIYLASAFGQVDIIDCLVQFGADVNLSGGKYGNPLQAACFSGHAAIVQKLVYHGANPKLAGLFENALVAACVGNREEVALLLLRESVISTQDEYDYALKKAAEAGFVEAIQYLQHGSFTAFSGSTSGHYRALEAAIMKGQEGVVTRFLRSPRLVQGIPQNAISLAALNGANGLIHLILSKGLDIEKEGPFGTPLRAASLMGHQSTVQLLLDSGADVNRLGSFGDALQTSAMRGHALITKILLQAGARVNSAGGMYGNALHAAIYNGHVAVVEILLDAGANVHQKGIDGDAFHAAVIAGCEDIVHLLLKRGYKSRFIWSRSLAGIAEQSYRDVLAESAHHLDDYQVQDGDNGGNGLAPHVAPSTWNRSTFHTLRKYRHLLHISTNQISEVFQKACASGDKELVETFIATGLGMMPYIDPAIEKAAFHGHLAIMEILLSYKRRALSIGDIQHTHSHIPKILVGGCAGGQSAVVNKGLSLINYDLLASDMAISQKSPPSGNTTYTIFIRDMLLEALKAAVNSGHQSLARHLIDNDTQHLLAGDRSLDLLRATYEGEYDLVKFCLSHDLGGLKITHEVCYKSALLACAGGHEETVRLFLMHVKCDYSYPTLLSRCLIMACKHGHSRLAEMLINSGADVNIVLSILEPKDMLLQSNDGSILHQMKEDCQSILCAPGIIYLERPQPISPLQAALSWFEFNRTSDAEQGRNQEETIKVLLSHDADINALGGHTVHPLLLVVTHCSAAVIRLFTLKGARIDGLLAENESLFHAAASREIGAGPALQTLYEAGIKLPDDGDEFIASTALSFFGSSCGRFKKSNSVQQVLDEGPGAAIRSLLHRFPQALATRKEYGMLLQMAAVAGDRRFVDLLIQREVDVNAVGYHYGTALLAAAFHGHKEVVKQLLLAGADPNIVNGDYETPLAAAVIRGHAEALDIVRLLLAAGADPNNKAVNYPALTMACELGHIQIAQELLSVGAEVNIPTKDGRRTKAATPLHAACANSHISLIHLLLRYGADANRQVNTSGPPLLVAAHTGNLEVIQLLLNAGASPNFCFGDSPLAVAALNGHFSVVQELLNAGAIIGDPPGIPNALKPTCENGDRPIIELFLDELAGNDKEECLRTDALSAACAQRDSELCELLLDGVQGTPVILSMLTKAGFTHAVRAVLNTGVAINGDTGDDHPLLVATYYQKSDIVALLLQHCADIHIKHSQYGGPLPTVLSRYALIQHSVRGENHVFGGYSESLALIYDDPIFINVLRYGQSFECDESECQKIVQALLAHGVDINAQTRHMGSVLHLASFLGHENTVQLLIEHGADVNCVGGCFETPLLAAIAGNRREIVDILLSNGADANYCSAKHGSALHIGRRVASKEVIELLMQHGAC